MQSLSLGDSILLIGKCYKKISDRNNENAFKNNIVYACNSDNVMKISTMVILMIILVYLVRRSLVIWRLNYLND